MKFIVFKQSLQNKLNKSKISVGFVWGWIFFLRTEVVVHYFKEKQKLVDGVMVFHVFDFG